MRFSKSCRSCSACFLFCFATSILDSKSLWAVAPGDDAMVSGVAARGGAALVGSPPAGLVSRGVRGGLSAADGARVEAARGLMVAPRDGEASKALAAASLS